MGSLFGGLAAALLMFMIGMACSPTFNAFFMALVN